ncbi:MAG: DUF4388 domain-containing protein [Chitinispirillaceae bacterium]|nr:DUF4388 domain-containing protein [Chitinispirillaceae bacterium]
MIVHNHITPALRHAVHQYDTLVVSRDHALFNQLGSFLKEFEPERTPVLFDNQASFTAFENALKKCDLMLCDIRSDYAVIGLSASAMECVPAHTLSIGLTNNNECSPEVLNLPQHPRFSGIIDNRNGWFANWHQIAAIRQAWHNPLMVSRIEEVPVNDVIQMISSGRWNTIVHIEGFDAAAPSSAARKPLRGCISFYQGEPQTAWSWRSAGIEAIFDLLSIKQGVLQVIKNLCAPTIRNVFLQTEEILLSYAVALDESAFTTSPGKKNFDPPEYHSPEMSPVNQCRDAVSSTTPVPVADGGKRSWWKSNGARLIETVTNTQPQSILLRWMNEEELLRIANEQMNPGFLFFYGKEAILIKLFSACSRGFSSGKMNADNRFPVLRLGRSHEQCLYISGLDPAVDRKCVRNHHAVLFMTSEEPDLIKQLCSRHHASLQIVTDPEHAPPQGVPCVFPDDSLAVHLLAAPDFSWQSLKTLLIGIISTLVDID